LTAAPLLAAPQVEQYESEMEELQANTKKKAKPSPKLSQLEETVGSSAARRAPLLGRFPVASGAQGRACGCARSQSSQL
jgi:hypothetical protein